MDLNRIHGIYIQIYDCGNRCKKYDFSNKTFLDKEDGILPFPEFLLLVLALHTGKNEIASIHPTKLHDTFKNNPIPQEEIANFYHELCMYRLLMDMY